MQCLCNMLLIIWNDRSKSYFFANDALNVISFCKAQWFLRTNWPLTMYISLQSYCLCGYKAIVCVYVIVISNICCVGF